MSRRRKRRTREHIVAEMSANFLERKILRRGYQLSRMIEYGTDAIMYHFGADGTFENGQVEFQLKATDSLKFTHDGAFIPVVVDEGNLDHWAKELHPFILLIYDAQKDRGYWLYIQEYVRFNKIYPKGDTVTLRIPAANRVTAHSIEYFADLSRKVVRMRDTYLEE